MTSNDTINSKYKTSLVIGDSGEMVVSYYETAIVTVDNNRIVLNTGGWQTATTRARMNFVSRELGLGYRVFQKHKQLFVDFNKQTVPFETDKTRLNRQTGGVESL